MKKIILMCTAAILLLTTIVGGSIASFTAISTGSDTITSISTKNLTIKLNSEVSSESSMIQVTSKQGIENKAVPGESITLSTPYTVTVEAGSYDAYIKVTINKSWADTDGETALDVNNIVLWYDVENGISPSDNWIISEVDQEQAVLYYTKPVEQGTTTDAFLEEINLPTDLSNDYAGMQIVLEVDVEAIQVISGVDAIKSAWGVDATINDDGVITAIID